jgi:hypothetical protein
MKRKVDQRKKWDMPPFFRNIVQEYPTAKESIMMDTVEKKLRKQPIQCWNYGGDHMHRDFP